MCELSHNNKGMFHLIIYFDEKLAKKFPQFLGSFSFVLLVQNMQPESHFDEIFKLAERNYVDCEPQFACDPEIGGCGKRKSILSYLRTPPHVFAIGKGLEVWK